MSEQSEYQHMRIMYKKRKEGEFMSHRCNLCGTIHYNIQPFKDGHICENCVQYMKTRNA